MGPGHERHRRSAQPPPQMVALGVLERVAVPGPDDSVLDRRHDGSLEAMVCDRDACGVCEQGTDRRAGAEAADEHWQPAYPGEHGGIVCDGLGAHQASMVRGPSGLPARNCSTNGVFDCSTCSASPASRT